MNLKVFIRHYSKNYRSNKENEFDWFENQPSLEFAIINAAEAKDEGGKRYSHQRALKEFQSIMQNPHYLKMLIVWEALILFIIFTFSLTN